MTFAEFRRQSGYSKRALARAQPRLAFLLEVGQFGAIMALVLVVADVTPLSLHADAPWRRLSFIIVWSVLMAIVTRTPLRAQDEPDASSPPVI